MNFLKKADDSVSQDMIGRAMRVKIEYLNLVVDFMNADGGNFDRNVLGEIEFINKVTKPFFC